VATYVGILQISWLICIGFLLSGDPNITDLLQGEHGTPQNFGRERVEVDNT